MKLVLLLVVLFCVSSQAEDLSCPILNQEKLTNDGSILLGEAVNLTNETVTMEITYSGHGWIGFGFSAKGRMVNTTAIIGLPNQPNSNTNPGKYYLGGKLQSAVQLVESDRQTLMNASIYQNDTHTVLKFTKHLVEFDETTISPTDSNIAIFAVGYGNSLSQHKIRGDIVLSLTPCGDNSSLTVNVMNTESPNKTLWVIHGVLMSVAFGVLIPIGISFSMLRHLFKMSDGGVWFNYHMNINMFAVLCIIGAFAIAIYNINYETIDGESPYHFKNVRHRTVGLTVFLIIVLQAVGGICRPELPKRKSSKREGETSSSLETKVERAHFVRKIWEVLHRVVGIGGLGLALYNCNLGINLFQLRFGDQEFTKVIFWSVSAGLLCLIMVMEFIQWIKRYFGVK